MNLCKQKKYFSPKEKLPEKGQRVKVLVEKEMIYVGNIKENSSEWVDDGFGSRGILFWEYLDE